MPFRISEAPAANEVLDKHLSLFEAMALDQQYGVRRPESHVRQVEVAEGGQYSGRLEKSNSERCPVRLKWIVYGSSGSVLISAGRCRSVT